MKQEKYFEERKASSMRFMHFWQLHQKLLASETKEEGNEQSGHMDFRTVVKPTGHAPFDTELGERQIRLLSQTNLITYIALLRRWETDSFVVMPFSHFNEPATDEELKLECDRGRNVRVLQAWNTRTLQDETLKKSWLVDTLTEEEAQEAWKLWCSSITGKEISGEIIMRTGLPIYRNDDPRLEYKRAELDNFASVDAEDLAVAENTTWDFSYFQLPIPKRQYTLAAGESQPNLHCEYVTEQFEHPVTVFIEYSRHDQELSLKVYDADGNASNLLDGYLVLERQEEKPLGEIRKGILKVASQLSDGCAICIVSPDGDELSGEIRKSE